MALPQALFSFPPHQYMHVIYVDESGTPELEANSAHFVIGALAIPLRSWKAHDAQLRELLKKRRLAGVELHAAWMARRYPEQERIAGFAALSESKRRELTTIERKMDLADYVIWTEGEVELLAAQLDRIVRVSV